MPAVPDSSNGAPFPLDLDGDGDLDLAQESLSGLGGIWVLINRGAAEFAEPCFFPSGSSLLSMDPGDLDLDGDLDLATATNGAVLVWNDGWGRFDENVKLEGPFTQDVEVADMDADGDPDVLTIPFLGAFGVDFAELRVHPNLGDGQFDPAQVSRISWDEFIEIEVGDLDLDRRPGRTRPRQRPQLRLRPVQPRRRQPS